MCYLSLCQIRPFRSEGTIQLCKKLNIHAVASELKGLMCYVLLCQIRSFRSERRIHLFKKLNIHHVASELKGPICYLLYVVEDVPGTWLMGSLLKCTSEYHDEKLINLHQRTPTQQTQNIFITCVQRRPNVFDVGPTLYKCYKTVLCSLGDIQIYGEETPQSINHTAD